MGRGTWYYSLGVFLAIVDAFVRSEFEISSWRSARVGVRTYLLGGAIDGSEANGIIRDPNEEILVVETMAEMVMHEKVVKMLPSKVFHKDISSFTPHVRNGISYGISTRSDADLRRLVSFDVFFRKARGVERLQELQGEGWFEWMRNGHVEVTAMPFGLTNAPAVFMELMSRMLYRGIGRRSEAKDEFELDLRQSNL
ncbi:hypothetical protein Tco_0195107, partial [Tanacetum coccineum]